ncbi:bifunctional hydroxymethylpyrimidine kinase/phosphomethylpyrimidine kinase [Emticicia agri]|uniref:hydroxymethylpyrimidine kinase n=1 Tax=Emticicia agri TaxID=2492393 RepID=A0A4Q5LTZ9_9BACT|nr:bifunctional hydroxymethylpyrimidine kinase/phosphomethylpyrimidine kinase [Emticicia agri]RYU93062.1 bifunctional hydroxymethylpyrimidine kinase/phosphomethylpyrimidine kinase [Emticicia agri]
MNKKYTYPSVLTIAGFDGSGGAGIQADIKTFSALGCFATSVLTALPVQNTQGVRSIYPIPNQAVAEQIEAIVDDIFPDTIKIGMVHTSELVATIVATLKKYPAVPLVFDPVMVATSGHKLIEDTTIQTIIEQLFPIASVITPNMDEAAILAQMSVTTLDDMYVAGQKILALGCQSVLLKGGHLNLPKITSLYFDTEGEVHSFEFEKFPTNNTHGSGCTLSSAIGAYIAQGKSLSDAVTSAQTYVHQAIRHGADVAIGKGNGPLNHFFNPQKLIKNEMV